MRRMFSVPHKKVKFNESVDIIYQPMDWSDDDYSMARRGPWTMMAADRRRFRRRIDKLSYILSPILTEEHRLLIRLRNMLLTE